MVIPLLLLCAVFSAYLELKLGENHAAGSDTVDIDLLVPPSYNRIEL